MKDTRLLLLIVLLGLGSLSYLAMHSSGALGFAPADGSSRIPGAENFVPALPAISYGKPIHATGSLDTVVFALLGIWFAAFLLYLPGRLLSTRKVDEEPT